MTAIGLVMKLMTYQKRCCFGVIPYPDDSPSSGYFVKYSTINSLNFQMTKDLFTRHPGFG